MSDAIKQRQINPKAESVQSSASTWLERREHGDWSGRDQQEFDLWLAVSPAHTIAYLRVEDVWNRANRLRALNHPERNRAAIFRRWTFLARIAAVAAVVVLVGAASVIYLLTPRDTIYTTEVGQRENLLLADGSQIELNTDTALRISAGGGNKTITLEKGEAYFDVKHDAKRPFVVRVGGGRVIDLGTRFLVRQSSNRIKVAVFEGRARFDLAESGIRTRSAVLVPGEVAVAAAGRMSVTKPAPQVLVDDLAWRRSELVFHFTSLADAAAEFNRYNQKKLIVQDSEIARLEIGGTFGMHDVTGFSRQVRHLLGIRADDRGAEIVLSR
jgi:transmembrane sensor